ncbi:MAG: Ig-like domain-containing protein [Duncaniella sp.]|nr:Ig-like domain-containing protein [Duncaniella sp.]
MDVPELTTVEDDVENNVITETHYNGWVANDGKSLKVYCVEDGADVSQEIVLGDFQDASYAFVATKVELEAGKNYTLYALGTTYVVNGIGYILPLMDADIAYPVEKYDYKFGSTDNELPVLANPNNLPVTYASSNTEVATVDENGNVDVLAVGTTVISATFEAANGYRGAVAQYTLSVAEAATVVSFIPGDKNNQGYEVCGTSSDNKSLTIGGVSYKSNLLYLANSWGDNENYIKLGVEGGFKKGDVVTIKGAINSGSKTAGIHLYSTKEHKLMTSEDFVDVKGDTSLEPTTVSYTLEAAAKNLYIARNGSTGLYICYISVEHPYSYVEPEAPEAPSYTAATGDDNVTVYTFTVAEGHNIYYRFDAAEEATEPETPAAAPMREAAATLEHDGQTYQLLNGSLSFTKNDNGTLTYFAHNPETDGRSELVTETISGGTTGLEEISAEAGVVEYYNLQGIRVAAPAEGVYIRKQGDNVSKVYVK